MANTLDRSAILDTSKLDFYGNFDQQVFNLLSIVRLSKTDVESIDFLVQDLHHALSELWPGCIIHCFGSIVTGLGIQTSDVDCYVELPSWKNIPKKNKIVFKAKHHLEMQNGIFTELVPIPMAKVPIVKFLHTPTNFSGDVNFTSRGGVQNSKLLGYLLHMDPRVLPLTILIKYWSKVHYLTGTNLMPNYALTLLVIFYSQTLNVLPSVYSLQRFMPVYMVDRWNMAYGPKRHDSFNIRCDLYELLGGFFDFYSNFDFESQVISTFLGCALPIECFKNIENVPNEYELYKYNLCCELRCQPLRINTKMCVQDVFEHNRNCTVAVHAKMFHRLTNCLKSAADSFKNKPRNEFLKAILKQILGMEQLPVPNGHQLQIKHKRGKIGKIKKRKNQIVKQQIQIWKNQVQHVQKNVRVSFNYGQYSFKRDKHLRGVPTNSTDQRSNVTS